MIEELEDSISNLKRDHEQLEDEKSSLNFQKWNRENDHKNNLIQVIEVAKQDISNMN